MNTCFLFFQDFLLFCSVNGGVGGQSTLLLVKVCVEERETVDEF